MIAAIIEASDLVKRFNGFTAVDHISFAVPEGVIFGFLGPNGAGKTTTIKMLTTVLTPSEGRLLIAGHDPVKEPRYSRSYGCRRQVYAGGAAEHGLDRAPKGRNETGVWWRRHDEYNKRRAKSWCRLTAAVMSVCQPDHGVTGRGRAILAERERIKRQTIANRRLQHQLQAA